MDRIWSLFPDSKSEGKKQPKNQRKQSKPEVYQILDSIDEESEAKNEKNKEKIKPDSNEQKSMSSGDFQQMNSSSSNDQKINKNQRPNQQPNNQNLEQINMESTMQFHDQINQSISESYLLKRPLQNSLKSNQMSFSAINQQNQTLNHFQKHKQDLQHQNDRPSTQYPPIGDSFQGCQQDDQKDQDNDVEQSFSSFTTKPAKSKLKNNKISYQLVNSYLQKIKPGSSNKFSFDKKPQKIQNFNLQQKQYQNPHKQSNKNLKNLNEDKNEEKIEDQDSNHSSFNSDQDQNELINVQLSMVAERMKPIGAKNKKPTSQTKNITDGIIQKQEYDKQNDFKPQSMHQSTYMQKVPDKPIVMPQKQKTKHSQNNINPKKQISFNIYLKDSLFFIQYRQTPDRRLSDKIFQSLTQSFLMHNIMLPFFSIKLLQDHEKQIEIGVKKQKQALFAFYANLYFEFLHKKYPNFAVQFFKKQIDKNFTKSKMMDSQIGLKKEQSTAILGHFYKKVIEYFKLTHYSKAQILKDSLQSELAFISQFKEKWFENGFDKKGKKYKDEDQKNCQVGEPNIRQKQLYLLKQIAGLQLLISFEKSEMYCEDKLKQKLEENIWKERKKKLIEDRNWFISNLFSSCQV